MQEPYGHIKGVPEGDSKGMPEGAPGENFSQNPKSQYPLSPDGESSPASAIRIACIGGLIFFPVIPAVLIGAAFLNADDSFLGSFFSVMLAVFAAISGLIVIATLMIAGFISLVRKVSPEDKEKEKEQEVFGSAVPSEYHETCSREELASLDLRYGWSPCLIYIFCFAAAQFIRSFFAFDYLERLALIEFVGGVINVAALTLFFFFWFTGYVRLNRAEAKSSSAFFFWPLLALLGFFLPIASGG